MATISLIITTSTRIYGSLEDFKALLDDVPRSRHARHHRPGAQPHLRPAPLVPVCPLQPDSPTADYYVWSDTDQKYQDARIIFLDTESSNWTWDEEAGQYFWHRFYASQPDLNFDNPAVQEEMRKMLDFWLDMGIDGFRADAVPYLFEREGTNCENLPETHAYLKRTAQSYRSQISREHLAVRGQPVAGGCAALFRGWRRVPHGLPLPGHAAHLHGPAPGGQNSLVEIMERTPPIPEDCQWCIFLRNHDELTLEMVTEEERQWMWQEYAPEPRMRLNLGIRRRLAPLLDNDRRKIELANSLLFTLPGSPIIYYGDEIGMGDNIELQDRNGVRTPMQWDDGPNAGFSQAEPDALYTPIVNGDLFGQEYINVRSQQAEKQFTVEHAAADDICAKRAPGVWLGRLYLAG